MSYALNLDASNKADWTLIISATDNDTGEDIDFTGALIDLKVQDSECCQRLDATVGNGITINGTVVTILFPASQMKALCAGSYLIGAVYQLNGETNQLFTGTITIIDGIASL